MNNDNFSLPILEVPEPVVSWDQADGVSIELDGILPAFGLN